MNLDMKGWLTLRVKPRQENRAEENLIKQEFNCYFPNICLIRAGKQKVLRKPMFPGYGFIEINKSKSLLPVSFTLGVIGIVHFGSYYPVMEPNILEEFKDLEKFSSKKPIIQIKEGDEVIILRGPLKGMNGIVSHIKKQRIEVLYILLNQSHKAELDLNSVSSQ